MVFLKNKPILLPIFDYKVDRAIHYIERLIDSREAKELAVVFKKIREKISSAVPLTDEDFYYVEILNNYK